METSDLLPGDSGGEDVLSSGYGEEILMEAKHPVGSGDQLATCVQCGVYFDVHGHIGHAFAVSAAEPKHPTQPIIRNADRVLRYKRNAIVCDLAAHATVMGFDRVAAKYSEDDRAQLEQLLGADAGPDACVSTEKKHPMQPVVWVGEVIRFKKNSLVDDMLDFTTFSNVERQEVRRAGGFDMNAIARHTEYPREDREQFAQLIGYSVSGYRDLSYVRRTVCNVASAAADVLIAERDAAEKAGRA